jgi:hypothetical protein
MKFDDYVRKLEETCSDEERELLREARMKYEAGFSYNLEMREADKCFSHAQNSVDHGEYVNAAGWIAEGVIQIERALAMVSEDELKPGDFRKMVIDRLETRRADNEEEV